ncbi:MAG TPA: EamA family transporter [Woeseiaceae bacterium]|nr:EamA family transporter [Woeseiaceae bacterium]
MTGASKSASLVALAALCWGVSGGIGGILTAEGWNAFVLALYRGSIGLLFVLAWLLLRPAGSGLANRRLWFWAGIAGFGVAGNFTFYFTSIAEGGVAVAATLMYCAPVYVYIVSFALKLEVSTPSKSAAVLVVMLGIVLLTRIYYVGAAAITPIGVVAGLLAGVCYAIFIFGFKFATPHGSPQAILTIAFAVLAAILIWQSDFNEAVAALSTPDWPLFVALGVFGAGLSFILYVVGIAGTRPTTAAIVAMIEPITASLFGVAIMNETLAGLQLVGMGMILLTVTAMSIHSNA